MRRYATVGAAVLSALLANACANKTVATGLTPSPGDEQAIRKVEEEYREAKLKHDGTALARVIAVDYYGVNQNGSARTKPQLLELWERFRIKSLDVDIKRIRISGPNAVVVGRQTETLDCPDCAPEIAIFMRTYVRRVDGWQMLSSAQYRDPNKGRPSGTGFAHDAW